MAKRKEPLYEPEQYFLRCSPSVYFQIVGCGGTGGYVAEGLCRLLVDKPNRIFLVDHDRVEERNIGRQNFYPEDLGKFKAQVLAERLARQFDRPIHYCVTPIEQLPYQERSNITIGCVDNSTARARLVFAGRGPGFMGALGSYQLFEGWYIDAGNSFNSGQVLIGNAVLSELKQAFRPFQARCDKLPHPVIQEPSLLTPDPVVEPDCADAVANEEQSPVINRVMGDLVLTFCHKLLTGTMTWMGAYIDLERGTLSTIDAKPETVSRMTGITVRALEYRPRKQAGRINE